MLGKDGGGDLEQPVAIAAGIGAQAAWPCEGAGPLRVLAWALTANNATPTRMGT